MNDRLIKESDVLKAIDKRIEELSKHPEFVRKNGHIDVIGVKKHILAIPSADRPQGEWIPCSERLPEKAGHYLCSFNKANRIDSIYVDLAYWTGGRWYGYLANEINAWMPLPEPWKGADDE